MPNNRKYYDPTVDYSVALQNPNLSAADRTRLTEERQNKINDLYGGIEPTMENGKTFSSQYGYNGRSGGTDWSELINSGIANGTDWRTVQEWNNNRQNKIYSNYGTLGQYDNDATYQAALAYITQQQQAENDAMWKNQVQEFRNSIDSSYAIPTYTPSAWDETKEKLAQAALGMNYDDWTSSDQYKALANRYGYQGKLGMQDVLGQIASRTGGLASSYATTAAQQQYNDYMAKLEEASRNAYNTERNNAITNAQAAYNFADSDYQRYLDELSQYNSNRSYAFDLLNSALGQSNYANEWKNTLDQQEYNRNLARAQTLAEKANDYSGYSALGYTDDEIARMQAANQLVTTSGGGTYRGTPSGDTTEMDYDGLFEAAKASGNPRSWLAQKANYTQYGFTSSSGLYNDYQEWEKEQSSKTVEGGWNKNEPFKNPIAPGGRNPSAGKTSGTTSNPGIPQRYIDEINRDAEGGMSVANLANKLERWVNEKKITTAQADWIAASFGY